MTDKGADRRPVIVYVINSFDRGGAEAGLLTLIKGGLFDNCQLKIVALVRGSGGLEKHIVEAGHKPEILVDRMYMCARDMPAILLRLWRFIDQSRPHIVIASLPQANLLARLCVLFRKKITFISFEHNSHLAKRIYEAGYRLTSWRVDWLFADAANTMKIVGKRLYRKQPAMKAVVPLACFEAAAKRTLHATSDGSLHIVNAARFTATKNQAALIEAVAILNGSKRDVTLTLYGDGPEREACAALAARLGIAPRVHFPGFVPDWQKRAADLFVLTSKHEGLCIVVLEAMHAGIPVVSPMTGGLRDYSAPEIMHVLASLEPHVIARAIAAAMDDTDSSRAMVSKAAEMIDLRFGVEAIRTTYGEINQELISRVQGPGPNCASEADARNARFARMRSRLE